MIEIKQVSQAYGTQDILKNVSMKIKEKRITALVGANGAGKTMMLLEKSWFYNRTSFFVYSWTNCVPVL